MTEPKGANRSVLRDFKAHPTGCHIQGKVYNLEPESSGQLGVISVQY